MLTFQEIIRALESFWAGTGCVIEQTYDVEMGAGTLHPATFLRCLGRNRGNAPMCSHRVVPLTAAMVIIPTVCTGTFSTR